MYPRERPRLTGGARGARPGGGLSPARREPGLELSLGQGLDILAR